ncbi:hypothetical protein E4U41_004776 [Claviceps citrina]|nr:hypothetical protein E4U41_004776 [Claviceps citrina]
MKPRTQFEPDVFTCTFCYRLSTQKPRVLGRSARLTCAECYATIIDLSICWACGELVLREADSVSFGWCFWHRACYGCLLCGSPKLCTGVLLDGRKEAGASAKKRDDCFAHDDDDDDDDDGDGREERRGEEMAQAPLCALCAVGCEVDSLDGRGILERGLRRIDLVDGGVTRRRWIDKSRQQTPLGHGGHDDHQKKGMASVPMFWVNMNDPINGPSFRPHPLKPLPFHMQHVSEHERLATPGLPPGAHGISRRRERAEGWKRHSEPMPST